MHAADSQVAKLSESIAAIAAIAAALPGESGAALDAHTREAIIAMQYHDQMMQHLTHVRDALDDVQHALGKPTSADDWGQVLSKVRSRFSTDDERRLFDRTMARPAETGARPEGTVAGGGCDRVELF